MHAGGALRAERSGAKCTRWANPGSEAATCWRQTRSGGEKVRRIRRHLRRLAPRSVVLAEDETDLLLFPPLRASWSPRGHPQEVVLRGGNARRVLFGTLNPRTGHRLYLVRERQRGEDFQAFLEVVHAHYRAWHVVLLLDEDPSHTAKASQALAAVYGITLEWLPKRSPPPDPLSRLAVPSRTRSPALLI